MAQIYFSSHSYCLLLIITQCSFLIYSLCSFETIATPFNFQPTIFSSKMQYNRPCKYSRPWSHSFIRSPISGCIQWQYNLSVNKVYVVGWLKFSHSEKIFSLQIEYSRKLMRWSGKNAWFIAQRDTIFPLRMR